ncbi:MAG: hypothetical protein ACLR5F_13340 [Faecalibacterium sp.]
MTGSSCPSLEKSVLVQKELSCCGFNLKEPKGLQTLSALSDGLTEAALYKFGLRGSLLLGNALLDDDHFLLGQRAAARQQPT